MNHEKNIQNKDPNTHENTELLDIQSREVGQKIIDIAVRDSENESETIWGKEKIELAKNAWYQYDNNIDFSVLTEAIIAPKLSALSERSRKSQNLFFTALAQEDSNNTNITFINDIMHSDDEIQYEEYGYDEYSDEYLSYYDFVGYLLETENQYKEQDYKQFLDWYREKLVRKETEFLEQAKICEVNFQEKLEQRVTEEVLPQQYLEGLYYLQRNGITYRLCDMVDAQSDFFDEKGAFGATASTSHREYNFTNEQQPLVTYNLAGDRELKKLQSNLDHEFLHLVGGNGNLLTYQEVINEAKTEHDEEIITRELIDANSIFEEGVVEIVRKILETGEPKIVPDGVYSDEQQVLKYLCEESSNAITIDDLLLAHAGRSADHQEQEQLVQKISLAFPWWQGKRGVMEMLIERRIWFGQSQNSAEEK